MSIDNLTEDEVQVLTSLEAPRWLGRVEGDIAAAAGALNRAVAELRGFFGEVERIETEGLTGKLDALADELNLIRDGHGELTLEALAELLRAARYA